MLIWKNSEAGTIREQNQDIVLCQEDQGLLILVDGHGKAGRETAEIASASLAERIKRIRSFSSISATKIKELVDETISEVCDLSINRPGFQGSKVNVALIFVISGNLFLAQTGTCGILARVNDQKIRLEPGDLPQMKILPASCVPNPQSFIGGESASIPARSLLKDSIPKTSQEIVQSQSTVNLKTQVQGPLNLKVGDWVLAFTEGLLLSQPLQEVEPFTDYLHQDPETLAHGLFTRASVRYDGDDRTLLMARFLPNDIKRLVPTDNVISNDLDVRFIIPLWVPLSCFLGGILFLFVGFLRWLKNGTDS